MTAAARLERVGYEAKRVIQTRRAFDNWRPLLAQMAAQRVGRGPAELTFATRTGMHVVCPNVPGARLAIYEQFADDTYHLDEFLAPLRLQTFTVLDVGSHVGSFALHLADRFPLAHIACFEPSQRSGNYLRRNIERNGLVGRVTAHEAALTDRTGAAMLDDNGEASVHNGLISSDRRLVDGQDSAGNRRAVEVDAVTFADAVARAGASPQVVKLDCEGGEYATVLASAPESWASVTHVVMEYHAVPGRSFDELRSWFADAGLVVTEHRSLAPGLGTAWLTRS